MTPAFSRKEKGQSLVELAMMFTLLLLIAGGIIDLGGMFYSYTALRDTSQEGAIYAASHPIDTLGINERIKKSASFPIEASQITDISVICSGSDCEATNIYSCQGQKITIQVGYNYKTTMPLIPAIIGLQTVPLKSEVTETILESSDTIATLKTMGQTCP